ncbi:MAG: type II toxin-antitoxin system RelE/ParE family toxin [Proteobacteria bacterium]|nr:type II toxin-antitoxin system RelE/ParE family toxin [Pseudomonadota bacterium]MBU4298149.1 type II toxin-antitoxin system RelE/ParE family toxin [Pseudomonadota bacterium]
MRKLMTRSFSKWATKQNVPHEELANAILEIESGNFEANLGGHILKKRIRFQGKGKSGSGRTIVCYKRENRLIFVHGFAKNEKANLTIKELNAFKELAKILLGLTPEQLRIAIANGDFIEVAK